MIDQSLIALARRFYEAGGCKAITKTDVPIEGHWYKPIYRDPVLATRDILVLEGAIPILTESELWEFLQARDYQIRPLRAYETLFALTRKDGRVWNDVKYLQERNLHHALYSAAVWVAERRKE